MGTGRKKKGKLEPVGDIIKQFITSFRDESDGELLEIWNLWDSAVDKIIAENTKPAAFKGKLLIVNTNSSARLQHLHFLKKEIILKVNKALGKDLVDEIKFKIGPVD